MLDECSDRPTCKNDNSVSVITGALGKLSKMLINAEKYGEFYYDAITGLQMDFDSEMDLIEDLDSLTLVSKLEIEITSSMVR